MNLSSVRIQPQRHKRVANGHPWIYSNEIIIDGPVKALESGTIVTFHTHDGQFIGIGSYNSHSLIAGRIFTRAVLGVIDTDWISNRLQNALDFRQKIVAEPYYRLVHAEADGLPGLIIDRFGSHISVQLNTAGTQKLWPEIETAIINLLKPDSIILHNDSYQRTMEGLDRSAAPINDSHVIEVRENNFSYFADLIGGQKTGWYYDQRDNHALVARYASNASVLDLYCYAGGFGLLAAKNGASSVTGVDSSQTALDLASKSAKHNNLENICKWMRADVFEELEKRITAKEKFDIVIADPPPFVKSRKDVASGARGYRKLAKMSALVTAQNGLMFIASCSHNMDLPMFTAEVARGLHEARREARIIHTVFAAQDHPVHPHLPESAYLKGLFLQLD